MSRPARDTISIHGIRGYGRHGVLPAERTLGQEFIVDVHLHVDTAAAAASDDLTQTVDYGAVAGAVHERIVGTPVDLIETLAERIASDCLESPMVVSVEVTVHKPQAPVSVPFDDISVTVRRP